MKKKQIVDIRTKDTKKLMKMVSDLEIEILNTRARIKVGKEKNLKKTKNLKRELAQIKTIIKQKEIEEKNKMVSEVVEKK